MKFFYPRIKFPFLTTSPFGLRDYVPPPERVSHLTYLALLRSGESLNVPRPS